MREFKNQIGFLTIAQNTDVDYLHLAYLQAKNIKQTQKYNQYAVIVDKETLKSVTDEHKTVFDYVIELPVDYAEDSQWKLNNEWQVFNLTPFKETIKLESDILFTRSIDHWWTAFRLRDVVLSLGCRDYQGQIGKSRRYRKIFDDNSLPDTYNGLKYFRYSQLAHDFFSQAKQVYVNWEFIRDNVLVNCRDDHPTTDLVYAIVANNLGVELCTLPGCDFINFTHMKNNINNWPETTPWPGLVLSELDLPMIRINNVNQYQLLHYQDKNWITNTIVERYESCLQN